MAIKPVKSLDDLMLPEKSSVDLTRGDDVLRVPIQAVSLEEQEKLMEKYKSPSPPMQWRKDPDSGKMVFEPNPNDPAYLEAVEEISTKQTRALALAGIDIEIEGEDTDTKYENLRKKLTIGDLTILLGAIMELSNVGEDKIAEAKKSLSRKS